VKKHFMGTMQVLFLIDISDGESRKGGSAFACHRVTIWISQRFSTTRNYRYLISIFGAKIYLNIGWIRNHLVMPDAGEIGGNLISATNRRASFEGTENA